MRGLNSMNENDHDVNCPTTHLDDFFLAVESEKLLRREGAKEQCREALGKADVAELAKENYKGGEISGCRSDVLGMKLDKGVYEAMRKKALYVRRLEETKADLLGLKADLLQKVNNTEASLEQCMGDHMSALEAQNSALCQTKLRNAFDTGSVPLLKMHTSGLQTLIGCADLGEGVFKEQEREAECYHQLETRQHGEGFASFLQLNEPATGSVNQLQGQDAAANASMEAADSTRSAELSEARANESAADAAESATAAERANASAQNLTAQPLPVPGSQADSDVPNALQTGMLGKMVSKVEFLTQAVSKLGGGGEEDAGGGILTRPEHLPPACKNVNKDIVEELVLSAAERAEKKRHACSEALRKVTFKEANEAQASGFPACRVIDTDPHFFEVIKHNVTAEKQALAHECDHGLQGLRFSDLEEMEFDNTGAIMGAGDGASGSCTQLHVHDFHLIVEAEKQARREQLEEPMCSSPKRAECHPTQKMCQASQQCRSALRSADVPQLLDQTNGVPECNGGGLDFDPAFQDMRMKTLQIRTLETDLASSSNDLQTCREKDSFAMIENLEQEVREHERDLQNCRADREFSGAANEEKLRAHLGAMTSSLLEEADESADVVHKLQRVVRKVFVNAGFPVSVPDVVIDRAVQSNGKGDLEDITLTVSVPGITDQKSLLENARKIKSDLSRSLGDAVPEVQARLTPGQGPFQLVAASDGDMLAYEVSSDATITQVEPTGPRTVRKATGASRKALHPQEGGTDPAPIPRDSDTGPSGHDSDTERAEIQLHLHNVSLDQIRKAHHQYMAPSSDSPGASGELENPGRELEGGTGTPHKAFRRE